MAGTFSFRDWYATNGERLNEQRRERYRSDPEYRKHVLDSNRTSRQKHKKTKKPKQNNTEGSGSRVIVRTVNGVEETLYTIGAVSKELGCSIQALRLWEKKGIIPPTQLRAPDKNGKGHRLYTMDMVDELRRLLTESGRLQATRSKQMPRPSIHSVCWPDGQIEEVELYLVGMLAQTLNKNVVALEQLEAKGLFPATPFRTEHMGRRLFTMPMIQAAWEVFRRFNAAEGPRGEDEWRAFTTKVLAKWKTQKVIGAALLEGVPDEALDVNKAAASQQ